MSSSVAAPRAINLSFDELKGLVSDRALSGETMLLNMGPQHPSTHGVLRLLLELDGERVLSCVPDVGFLHTGIEKTCESKTYTKVIPLTDRMDYLSPMSNNLGYVLAVEKLMNVEVPLRAQYIRVILCELQRIASHLVWLGTHAIDLAAMSLLLYCFREREIILDIFEMVSGQRMMASYFRIGGLWRDVPAGFEDAVRQFLNLFPARVDEYEALLRNNPLWLERTRGIGVISAADAVAMGVTGPSLRGSGINWDVRKAEPYSSYDQFEFDVPTAVNGDSYDRCVVRVEEIRQSVRIIRQCLDNMPSGPYKAAHRLTTPPPKERTMHDIETLIQHFLNVSWGPVIPPGECSMMIEATKGWNSYFLVSDGGTMSYRTRIRTPSFPHLQMIPLISRGLMVADLIAILASIDFVMADVDR